jgi:hypothetical protein
MSNILRRQPFRVFAEEGRRAEKIREGVTLVSLRFPIALHPFFGG